MKLSPQDLIKQLDWNLLRVFIVIVQEQSITKSAHRLLLSQPAVSSALKRLETTLDTQLINRDNRRITVTKTGQNLYKECLHIQGAVANIANVLTQYKDQLHGKVTIHIAEHIQSLNILETINQFQEMYPNVEVRLYKGTHDEVIYSVLNSMATVGFISQRSTVKQFQEHLIEKQSYGLFCGQNSKLFGQENISNSVLQKHLFYAYHEETLVGSLSHLMQYRVKQGMAKKNGIHINSVHSMMELIQCGAGVGFLPLSKTLEQRDSFWHIPLSNTPEISVYSIVNSRGKHNTTEVAFLEYIHTQAYFITE